MIFRRSKTCTKISILGLSSDRWLSFLKDFFLMYTEQYYIGKFSYLTNQVELLRSDDTGIRMLSSHVRT